MTDFPSIHTLLKRYNLKPQKGLGQNFLNDPAVLARVVDAAQIQPGDTVLEVGPGLGSLTHMLAEHASRVVAVELDNHLVAVLEEILQPYPNVELVSADILEIKLSDFFTEPGWLAVANIPYYITSALLRHLLEAKTPPTRLVLTVQKEVAERICASAGEMNLLALSVQVYGKPSIAGKIPAGAFYPVPKVDSAVVRVDLYPEPLFPPDQLDQFFKLTKAGFSQKRKTLHNALSGGMHWDKARTGEVLTEAGIDPKRRAQTLSIEEWGELVKNTMNE